MTFDQVLTRYLAQLQQSSATRHVVAMSWRRFSEFLTAQGLSELEEVAPAHIEGFQQRLNWEPSPSGGLYATNTVYSILRQVRNVLRWATDQDLIARDPARDLSLGRPLQPNTPVLGWSELKAILAACDRQQPHGIRDAALFTMLAETRLGLRGCLALDLRDVAGLELEAHTAELLRAYCEGVRPLWVRAPGQRALFLTEHGGRLGTQTVSQRLDGLARLGGVEGNVTPRMLWRSYRLALTQAGSSRLVFPLAENP